MATFSIDENKVTLNSGERYRTEQGIPGKCDGCHMKKNFICKLAEELYAKGLAVMGATLCQPERRKDKRSIIWVKDI